VLRNEQIIGRVDAVAGRGKQPKPAQVLRLRLVARLVELELVQRGERNHDLLNGAEFLGSARIAGSLYEVPTAPYRPYAYPALVVPGAGTVAVELYRVTAATMLAALDELELYQPGNEAQSQYLRRTVPVLEHRAVPGGAPIGTAAVYVYNGPPEDLGKLLETGDWIGG